MMPFSYFDLIDAFSQPGCAICNLLKRDAERLLDSILFEYVTDPAMQTSFRASRGLCNEHGWRMAQMGNVLGIAVLHEAVIDEVLKILHRTSPNGNAQRYLSRLLFPQGSNAELSEALSQTQPCVVCKMQNASEVQYVNTFVEYSPDEKMQTAYRNSEGLCLEHFKQVLRHTHDAQRSEQIVTIQTEIWTNLQSELREFIRKYDFQNVDEKIGAEGDSWSRAIATLSGQRGIFGIKRTIP